jgi:hypothetical protein
LPIYVHGLIWAAVGFVVPVFWGLLELVFMHSRNPIFSSKMYWNLVYITCPPWLLPDNSASLLITPLLNACIYGGLALAIIGTLRWLKGRSELHLR